MGIDFRLLKKSLIFKGLEEKEIENIVKCLKTDIKEYEKDERVFYLGEKIQTMGLVLSGSVHVIKEDYWGNRVIVAEISEGDLFGETYACLGDVPLAVDVVASKKTGIMLLDVKKLFTTCASNCTFHEKVITNLVMALAQKNLMLTRKMEHISRRTTREKLLSYLSEWSMKTGASEFDIPFNRQQLADYLSVDRSAMTNELGKLRNEGILECKKNHFRLL